MKNLIFVCILFFASCEKDGDGITIGGGKKFCWSCTFKTTANVNGSTDTQSFKSDVCDATESEIRKFEKDNSGFVNHGNNTTTNTTVTCTKK